MNIDPQAEHWMQLAAEVATKSLCNKAHCGSVIVKEGEVIGRGYNAPPQDDLAQKRCNTSYTIPSNNKHDLTCCVHAEQRAIQDALIHNPDKISGSALYFIRLDANDQITKAGEPYCTMCSRAALDAKIAEFVLWHESGITSYNTAEYNNLSYQHYA